MGVLGREHKYEDELETMDDVKVKETGGLLCNQ